MFGRLLILSVVLVVAGCDVLNFGCSLVLGPGIRVTVLDSISGQQLAVNEVTVVAVDGAFVDTAQAGLGQPHAAVFDRPGTYRVEVIAPGYSPWVQEGVRVEPPGECGVRTVELVARLQPAG